MVDPIFDHEKLDVYRLSIEYVGETFEFAATRSGLHRHSRDQWLRAAQSIPLKFAEGNGKRSLKDRSRFFDIARGMGGGTGPASGSWWAWFGGIATFEQGQLVQQTMMFPVGTATLSFDYEKPVVDNSTVDSFEVRIDGNVVFADNGGGGAFVGYVNQSVNLDTYADGNTHSLEFFSQVFGNNGGVTNFFVDNVSIEGVPEPSGLSLLSAQRTTTSFASSSVDGRRHGTARFPQLVVWRAAEPTRSKSAQQLTLLLIRPD